MTTYTLAGGCFWCLDAVFRRLKGVEVSMCGYAGGLANDANYSVVSTGTTGHAEAVQVTFDETVIPAETILDIFFLIHNPTTKDRQGADVGPHYRSAMFYANDTQKQLFETVIKRAQVHWDDSIVTDLTPLDAFYKAELEHQDYFNNNLANGYCSVVIAPKILKVRQAYAEWFKTVGL
jgi:peptide-methionine (S)-S-oxide reductase